MMISIYTLISKHWPDDVEAHFLEALVALFPIGPGKQGPPLAILILQVRGDDYEVVACMLLEYFDN